MSKIVVPKTSIASVEIDSNRVSLDSIKCYVDPVQDLHGYTAPWIGGTKKNLIDQSKYVRGTLTSGVYNSNNYAVTNRTFYLLKAGTYTYSAQFNKTGGPQVAIAAYSAPDEANFTSYITSWTSTVPYTFTIEEDTYLRFAARVGSSVSVTVSNINFMQVESGSSATDYEPYENICPIPMYSGLSVVHSARNVVYAHVNKANVDDNGAVVSHNSYGFAIAKVIEGQQYTVSSVNDTSWVFAFFEKEPTIGDISYNGSRIVGTKTDVTTLVAPITGWMTIRTLTGQSAAQVEAGNVASEYEDYTENVYPFSWQTEAGTAYGILDAISGKLIVVAIGVTLTGEETFSLVAPGTTNQRFTLTIPSNTGTNGALVSHGSLSGSNTGVFGQFRVISSGYFVVLDGGVHFADVAALQTWLAEQYTNNTPVQFVYTLTEPVEYTITPADISFVLGSNNLFSSIGDIELEYEFEDRVTIKLNGTDMTDYFVPRGIKVRYEKVLGKNGGTFLSGDREEDILAWKAIVTLTCMPLDETQQAEVLSKVMVDDPTLYYFDPRTNAYRTIHYMASIEETVYRGKGSNQVDYWTGIVITAEEK